MFVHDLKSAWCVRERNKLRQFLNLLNRKMHEGSIDTTDATKEVK